MCILIFIGSSWLIISSLSIKQISRFFMVFHGFSRVFAVCSRVFSFQDDGEKIALGERYGFRVNGPGKQVTKFALTFLVIIKHVHTTNI
jgi:hypothetical protein